MGARLLSERWLAGGLAVGAGLAGAVLAGRFGAAGLALPALAALVVVLVRRPDVLLAVLVSLVLLAERGEGALIPGSWFYVDRVAGLSGLTLLLGLVALGTLLEVLRRRQASLPHPAIAVGLGLLVCAVAVGAVTAAYAGVAATSIYDSVLSLSVLLLMPVLVHVLLDTPERVKRALVLVGVLVLAKAALGVVAVVGGLSTPDPGIGSDAEGTRLTYYEPTINWLCLVMALVGVTALLRRVDLPRWVLWAMPVVIASLVLSYRRSFWIATVLGVLIVLLLGSTLVQRRLAIPAALAVGAGLWAVTAAAGVTERTGGVVRERAESLTPAKVVVNRQDRYRFDERANVVEELRRRPLTGLGFGVPWVARRPLPVENENGRTYVHFAALWFWLKTGILGAAGYLALIGGAIVAALRVSRRHADPVLAAVALALAGGLIGLAVAEVTATFTGSDPRFSATLGVALGLLSRLRSAVPETAAAPRAS